MVVDKKVEQDLLPSKSTFRKTSNKGSKDNNNSGTLSDTLRGNLGGNNKLYQLFYQMSRLTADKGSLRHDDRLDALSIAVGYWVEHMQGHTDRAVQDYRNEQIDKELERFMESHNKLWGKQEATTWM